jgi:DNA-directed RNA polymerase subunit RPC12/RpoP
MTSGMLDGCSPWLIALIIIGVLFVALAAVSWLEIQKQFEQADHEIKAKQAEGDARPETEVRKEIDSRRDENKGQSHPSQINRPTQCPRCASTEIKAEKKGFGMVKGAIGCLLQFPFGLLLGFIGSGKTKITCPDCGHSWVSKVKWKRFQKKEGA